MEQENSKTQPPQAGASDERRSGNRIHCCSRATLLGITEPKPWEDGPDDMVLEVATTDLSETGVGVKGSQLLSVGQPVLFRMGTNGGFCISAQGKVARCAAGSPCTDKSDPGTWGIRFTRRDVDGLQRSRVFEALSGASQDPEHCAVIISEYPLELLWWLVRLPDDVHSVFVGTSDRAVLERMRELSPNKQVHSLPDVAPLV